MKNGALLGVIFFSLLLLEQSFFQAFIGGLEGMPIMIIAGMIIMQRVGIWEGSAWLIASAFFHYDIGAFFLAFIGPMLILKIFTTRSIYALMGFGVSAYTLSAGSHILFGEISLRVFGFNFLSPHPIMNAVNEIALLIPGLIIGIFIMKTVERRILIWISFKHQT